jgi:hypothetical protein
MIKFLKKEGVLDYIYETDIINILQSMIVYKNDTKDKKMDKL